MQANTTANAETDYSTSLTMTEGASICVEDEFQGIRWETTVTKDAAFGEDNQAQFGVLVAPTQALTSDLTHQTKEEEF